MQIIHATFYLRYQITEHKTGDPLYVKHGVNRIALLAPWPLSTTVTLPPGYACWDIPTERSHNHRLVLVRYRSYCCPKHRDKVCSSCGMNRRLSTAHSSAEPANGVK
jgi:hypothetical protein